MLDDVPRTRCGERTTCSGGSMSTTTARRRGTRRQKPGLEPDDVGPANQFYTPHTGWFGCSLTTVSGSSISKRPGKVVGSGRRTLHRERKRAPRHARRRTGVPELCTYLIPDGDDQDAPRSTIPRNSASSTLPVGVATSSCTRSTSLSASGGPRLSLDRSEIPAKILEHNLYGVDIDLRSCQLSRSISTEGTDSHRGQDVRDAERGNRRRRRFPCRRKEKAVDVLDQTGRRKRTFRGAHEIIEEFQTTEALGSLLDVRRHARRGVHGEQTDVMDWG